MSFKSDLFKRASFLRREEIGATAVSPKFLSEGSSNREVFVFDHDIIDSFCRPWRNGPQKANRYGFGQVMPRRSQWNYEQLNAQARVKSWNVLQRAADDEDEVAERILEVLCEHVIKKATATGLPIFQSKFHAERTDAAFEGLRNKVQRGGLNAGNRELRQTLLSRQQLAFVSNAVRTGDVTAENDFIDELIYRKRDKKSLGLSALTLTLDRFDELSVNHPTYRMDSDRFGFYIDDDPGLLGSLSKLDEVIDEPQIRPGWTRHQRLLWAANNALVSVFTRATMSHGQSETKIPTIETLAWIYLANLECYRLGRTDIRFVFATLDQGMVENVAYDIPFSLLRRLLIAASHQAVAVHEDESEFINDLLVHVLPDKATLKSRQLKAHPSVYFALNFVRHIWGYLGDCFGDLQEQGDVLRKLRHAKDASRKDQSRFPPSKDEWDSWKNLFAGAFPDSFGMLGYRELERNSVTKSGVHQLIRDQNIGDVLNRYEDLISVAIRNAEFIEAERNAGLRKAISKAIQLQDDYDWVKLADQINDELAMSKLRALVSLSHVGAQVVSGAVNLGSRHPPNLSFESLPATNQIFERLFTTDGYLSHGDFFDDFEGIVKDCWNSPEFSGSEFEDDREEIHLKLLVLGAAFASADRWSQAFQNALKALEVVERAARFGEKIPVKSDRPGFKGKKSFISGREAYFLASVAKRVSSRSLDELEPSDGRGPRSASDYLSKARECLARDHEKQTGLSLTSLRFDAEQLGLKLAQYYMARYLNDIEDRHADRSAESSFVDRYESIRESCMELHANRLNAGAISPLTDINCATNILQTCTSTHYRRLKGLGLGRFQNGDLSELEPLIRFSIERCEHVAKKQGIIKTLLIDVYTNISKLILEPSLAKDSKFTGFLIDRIDEGSRRNVAVYDRWRYRELKWFVETCL